VGQRERNVSCNFSFVCALGEKREKKKREGWEKKRKGYTSFTTTDFGGKKEKERKSGRECREKTQEGRVINNFLTCCERGRREKGGGRRSRLAKESGREKKKSNDAPFSTSKEGGKESGDVDVSLEEWKKGNLLVGGEEWTSSSPSSKPNRLLKERLGTFLSLWRRKGKGEEDLVY